MDDHLHVFEVVIKSFSFFQCEPSPDKCYMKTIIKFDKIHFEISADGSTNWDYKPEIDLEYGFGKSLLFPERPNKIKSMMELLVRLEFSDINREMGEVELNWPAWDPDNPCKIEGQFPMRLQNDVSGFVTVYLRMRDFGENIQSKFFMKPANLIDEEEYYFQVPNIPDFIQCKSLRHVPDGLRVLTTRADSTAPEPVTTGEDLTWANLFKTNLGARFSIANPEFGTFIAKISTYSMFTMGEHPIEEKVKEICQMIEHIVLDLDKEENPDIDILTPEEIISKCCKHRDCEGVRKFQEAGIIFPDFNQSPKKCSYDNQPLKYGLSKTFGDISYYSPDCKYRRPKRVHNTFYQNLSPGNVSLNPIFE